MSKENFFKERAAKEADRFFGEGNVKRISNKYFTYKPVLDEDTIILKTGDLKVIKGCYVLITGERTAVYLKDFQIREAHYFDDETRETYDFWLVKLSRHYFKTYTFRAAFEGREGEPAKDFDDLKEIAAGQAGQSTGRGFSGYAEGKGIPTREDVLFRRCLNAMANA